MKNKILPVIFPILLLLPLSAHARLEYALEHRINSCTGCHAGPFGGGPKNLDGKMYASRFDEPSPWSKQELFSLDARAISYYPNHGTVARQGTALMTTSAWLNLPIKPNPNGKELRFVGGYSFAQVYQDAREVYGQWRSDGPNNNPAYIQVGRFNVPFGILSDEHRLFTRLLTRTEIFNYEMGASISKNIGESIHYDLAVVNGGRSGGKFVDQSPANPDSTVGYIGNARWMPANLPILIGVMGEYQDRLEPNATPNSIGGYAALSIDRLTGHRVSGSILGEAVYARHFADSNYNPNITRYFVPAADNAYLAQISGEPALAWYVQANWNVKPRWIALYRFERITFDPTYTGDRFLRQSFGLKYYADSNVSLMARYEAADVGRPEIKGQNVQAAQDAFWLMAQLWL